MRNGFQLGLSGADKECNCIAFTGQKANWKVGTMKVTDEVECAKRFCSTTHPRLTIFTKDPQDSPVDIVSESTDGSVPALAFQVTALWDEAFWGPYGYQGNIEKKITYQELTNAIEASIQKKVSKYSSSSDVILLIDPKPADLPTQCLERIRSDTQFRQKTAAVKDFSEIWLADANGAVQLK